MSVEESQTSQSQQSTNLTIQDLASIINIIDLASQRGAFKASEMTAVGTIYTKLTNFINEVPKQTSQG